MSLYGLEAVALELVFKLLIAVVAVLIVRVSLHLMDEALDVQPFRDWIQEADPHAKAIYYGARIVAICLLVGFALS